MQADVLMLCHLAPGDAANPARSCSGFGLCAGSVPRRDRPPAANLTAVIGAAEIASELGLAAGPTRKDAGAAG